MIRLPKVSDPANLMERNSLYRGTPVQQRHIGCPAANLFNPQINPAVGKVENLMTMSRAEMAALIARQQGSAEKVIQNQRELQQEQLEAPASAMELYYMNILKTIRQKEQAEIDNAYLTQQQKNDLQASALARKAGIDGNLLRFADELVGRDREAAALDEKMDEDFVEAEARSAAATGDPRGAASSAMDERGEMGDMVSAAMASAGGAARAEAERADERAQALLDDLNEFENSLMASIAGASESGYLDSPATRRFVRDNQVAIKRDMKQRLETLVRAGVYTANTARSKMTKINAVFDGIESPSELLVILRQAGREVSRRI